MAYENGPIACGATKAQSQVGENFSDLSKSIGNLDDLLSRLGDKLCPVLRMEPEAKGLAGAPDCTIVPLAEEVRSHRRRVDRAADLVQSWLNRIEL